MVRVRGERGVERDDVALLQQFVERNVVGRGLRTSVVGQDPAAESPQPVHDRRADASRSDDPDGQVAQLFPAHVMQPVVMSVRAADDGFRVPDRHQHQHQRVVGHAVGRIGDITDADADALRVVHVDVVVSDASRGDVPDAGPAERQQGGVRDPGFVADADAPVSGRQLDVGLGHRCLGDSRHNAEARRDLPEHSGLVRPASVDGDSHARDGRGGRGRHRPGAAGRWSRWLAGGHALQSRQPGVASTYAVFDTPTICCRP